MFCMKDLNIATFVCLNNDSYLNSGHPLYVVVLYMVRVSG